jgi:HSP20 family protein
MAQLPARRSARNITLVDPSREFEDIYDRMGQLMSMAFGDLAFTPALAAAWTPLADISETDDAYLVEVELPGVNKDQVNVDVNDRELVITGEIAESQEEEEEEGRRRRRRARRTGRFEFRTTLPGDIDPQGVSASLSDGILTVRVPKSEAAKPRRVEISG